MKKRTLWSLIALIGLMGSSGAAHARQLPLSDSATASIITCGAGNEFYTTFGHSAIRICDPTRDIDNVYNYGTFDFGAPHFYWNFVRGRLNYRLACTRMEHFLSTYYDERRAVWEQPLRLTPQEVNNLYVALEWNNQPENRYYLYDFFRDNCATRVRDMVEGASGLRVPTAPTGTSYRRYVHLSTGPTLQWWTLGVDLLLGLPADHRCSASEAMFHPLVMMQQYDTLCRAAGPLTAGCRQWMPDRREPLQRSFPPVAAFALLLAAVALLTWRNLWRPWMDRVLFVLCGVVGLVLCFMWFGTDHYCTAWNPNILWASPLLLLIAIRLERSPLWALWLQAGCLAVAAVWVVACGVSAALLPIILTLALRLIALMRRKPRQLPPLR